MQFKIIVTSSIQTGIANYTGFFSQLKLCVLRGQSETRPEMQVGIFRNFRIKNIKDYCILEPGT
jgi:hypothetical protein